MIIFISILIKHVDLMVFSYAEEKKVGTQHRKVWVIHPKGEHK